MDNTPILADLGHLLGSVLLTGALALLAITILPNLDKIISALIGD